MDLPHGLGGQRVRQFPWSRSEDEAKKVLQFNQHALSAHIHAQMHEPGHYWEKAEGRSS